MTNHLSLSGFSFVTKWPLVTKILSSKGKTETTRTMFPSEVPGVSRTENVLGGLMWTSTNWWSPVPPQSSRGTSRRCGSLRKGLQGHRRRWRQTQTWRIIMIVVSHPCRSGGCDTDTYSVCRIENRVFRLRSYRLTRTDWRKAFLWNVKRNLKRTS